MPKTKRDEKESRSGQPRKRLHLDVLFEQDARQLLDEYGHDELNRIYEKVIDIEEELLHKLEYDEGVAEIVGAKIDKDSIWFLVQWESGEKSFVPGATLKKIAPHKLMKYYESRLQFLPSPPDPTAPVGLSTLLHKSKEEERSFVDQKPNKPKQQPPAPKPQAPQRNAASFQKRFRTMNCQGCQILLQYPEGTKIIRCPKCGSTMAAQ